MEVHDPGMVLGQKNAKFLKTQFLANFLSFESTSISIDEREVGRMCAQQRNLLAVSETTFETKKQ